MTKQTHWLPLLLLPPLLAATPLGPGREPQLASSAAATYVTFAHNNDILLSTSTDAGQTFSPPTPVATLPKLMLGLRRGPHIAISSDHTLLITAISATDGNLVAFRSTDAGHTFSDPIKINDVDHSAREGLHHLTAGPDRRLYAVWLDLRTGHTRIQGSLSRDAGLTWEPNDIIYDSPDGHTCECCQPSATFLDDTHVAVMFRNFIDPNRDMYLTTFSPGSIPATGAKTQLLSPTPWPLNACPMDGGSLTTDPTTHLPLAAFTSNRHLYLYKDNTPTDLGPGTQPWLTPDARLVYTTARTGRLLYLPPNSTTPLELAPTATDPVLTANICAYTADGHIYAVPLPRLTPTPNTVPLPGSKTQP